MAFDAQGRTVMVTGAGRGIGRELSRLLIASGVSRLIAVGRDSAGLQALCNDYPGKVVLLQCDLSKLEEVRRLVAEIGRSAPELSLLINNAATQRLTDFVAEDYEATQPETEREIAVNLTAPIALCAGLLPVLARQPSAAIVNITTGLVLAPKMSAPVYCASKAGLSAFTRSLRYQCEAGAPNVRVIEALPPIVDTDMTKGRGRGKISAEACAIAILGGLTRGRDTIDIGKTGLLRFIMRVSPSAGYGIMRRG